MAVLGKGADNVSVGVSGLDLGVVERRRKQRHGGRNALPGGLAPSFRLAAIDDVTSKIGIGNRLPAQINRGFGSVFAYGGTAARSAGTSGGN